MTEVIDSPSGGALDILLFSAARDRAGVENLSLPVPGPVDSAFIWDALLERFPALDCLRESTRLARNSEYATTSTIFQPGDEVAVIPPVSGG